METYWQYIKININSEKLKITMSYTYSYHLLPFETYEEWFNADWKSLIHNVCSLQNECVYLELSFAMPHPPQDHVLDFISEDCILQANNIQHKILDIRLALLSEDELSTLLQLQ